MKKVSPSPRPQCIQAHTLGIFHWNSARCTLNFFLAGARDRCIQIQEMHACTHPTFWLCAACPTCSCTPAQLSMHSQNPTLSVPCGCTCQHAAALLDTSGKCTHSLSMSLPCLMSGALCLARALVVRVSLNGNYTPYSSLIGFDQSMTCLFNLGEL